VILPPSRVTVELRPLDRDNTPKDALQRRGARVPKYLPPVRVVAMVEWTDHRARTTEGMSGADVETDGVMTLPISNGRRAGYTPDSGDLLVSITYRDGTRSTYEDDRIHITKATEVIPGVGGFQAWECTLRDRSAGR
jgi:hypothetical protein